MNTLPVFFAFFTLIGAVTLIYDGVCILQAVRNICLNFLLIVAFLGGGVEAGFISAWGGRRVHVAVFILKAFFSHDYRVAHVSLRKQWMTTTVELGSLVFILFFS